MEFDISAFFFFKSVTKGHVSLKSDTNNGTLRINQYIFLIISCSVPLRTKNISDQSCAEVETRILCSMTYFFSPRKSSDNVGKILYSGGRPQMTICPVRSARWIPTATNTHTHTFCNTHCFSTAPMHLNVMLHVHCLSCSPIQS